MLDVEMWLEDESFETFLSKEFASENLTFLRELKETEKLNSTDQLEALKKIYHNYISNDILNIDHNSKVTLGEAVKNNNLDKLKIALNEVKNKTIMLLQNDNFMRFKATEAFKKGPQSQNFENKENKINKVEPAVPHKLIFSANGSYASSHQIGGATTRPRSKAFGDEHHAKNLGFEPPAKNQTPNTRKT